MKALIEKMYSQVKIALHFKLQMPTDTVSRNLIKAVVYFWIGVNLLIVVT